MNRKIAVFVAVALVLGCVGLYVPIARASTLEVNDFNNAPTEINITVTGGVTTVSFRSRSPAGNGASEGQVMNASYNGVLLGGNRTAAIYDVWGNSHWCGLILNVGTADNSGANETVSTSGGTFYYGQNNYWQYIVPSFSWRGSLATTNGTWVAIGDRTAVPLSVSIAGPVRTGVSGPSVFTATAAGGTAPYRYLWAIDWITELSTTEVYLGTLGTVASLSYRFTFVGHFRIRVTCLDSTDAEATDGFDVNAGVDKPVLHGQLLDYGENNPNSGMALLSFSLFDDKDHGSSPWSVNDAIVTTQYEVNSPAYQVRYDKWFALVPIALTALPDPLVVSLSYTDPQTQVQWMYTFSFPTTGWAPGDWADSTGAAGGSEVAPTWLNGLDVWLGKVLSWLFVPSNEDVVKAFSSVMDESPFNPFLGVDLPAPSGSLKLLRKEDLGTSVDVTITIADNLVFEFVRLGFKFALTFGAVMMVLGAL